MTAPDGSDQDPPESPTAPITMTVSGSQKLAHRRFTQADVGFIDALLREGPFDDVEWTVNDQQGTTRGIQLSAVLHNVIWHSVKNFSVLCTRQFLTPHGFPDSHKPMTFLRLELMNSIGLQWYAAPENRQPVELTYTRLVHFLEQLPVNRGYNSRFTDTPESELKSQPHWWNPLRSPRSIIDWIAIGVLATLAVAAVTAIALLIPKMF